MKKGIFWAVLFLAAFAATATAQGATKRTIVLSATTNGTTISYQVAMWYPITTGVRTQTAGSVWVASGTSTGAAAAENTAIQNGSIYEEVQSFTFPVGTPVANIQAVFQQAWTERNTQIAGNGANIYYGYWWDGTTWSNN